MFKEGGNVTHFAAPKGTFPHNTEGEKFAYRIAITNAGENLIVHASVPSNTFANYGNGEDKELTELAPGILNQLGPEASADVPLRQRPPRALGLSSVQLQPSRSPALPP